MNNKMWADLTEQVRFSGAEQQAESKQVFW